jgi:hypothetical protein
MVGPDSRVTAARAKPPTMSHVVSVKNVKKLFARAFTITLVTGW